LISGIAQDPVLGPVFYVVDAGAKGELRIERDTNPCMNYHAIARTISRKSSPPTPIRRRVAQLLRAEKDRGDP
jgi:hypothetical protein